MTFAAVTLKRLLLFTTLLPCYANAAFSVDVVAGTGSPGATARQASLALNGSANLLLCGVAVGYNDAGTDPLTVITSMTWNGVAMTAVASSDSDDNNFEAVRWYRMNSPATGTHDAVLTVSDSAAQSAIGCISFIDASTTLKAPSVGTGTTANPALTVADTDSGNIVVSGFATDGSTSATTQAGTLIAESEDVDTDSDFNFQYQTASGASTVASWTNSTTGSGWATSGVGVAASGGGGSSNAPRAMHYKKLMSFFSDPAANEDDFDQPLPAVASSR